MESILNTDIKALSITQKLYCSEQGIELELVL